MEDRTLELCLADGRPFCHVRVPHCSIPPPIVVYECRFFHRGFDWRYRETQPVLGALVEPLEDDDEVAAAAG